MSQELPPELQAVYAAPATEPERAHANLPGTARVSGYRARLPLVRILIGVLLVEGLLQGLNAAFCGILASDLPTFAQRNMLDWLSQIVSKAYAPIWILGFIPFAWFLLGSNKNARAFVGARTRDENEDDVAKRALARAPAVLYITPWSMVWLFFIPLVNLVQPYKAVKAVWNASRPERTNQPESSSVLGRWWLSYLLALLVPRLGLALIRVNIVDHNLIASFSNLVGVAASLFAVRMVLALHERQSLRAAELWPSDPEVDRAG